MPTSFELALSPRLGAGPALASSGLHLPAQAGSFHRPEASHGMQLRSGQAPAGSIHQQAGEWVLEIARGPVGVMGLAKRALDKALFAVLEEALDYEAHLSRIRCGEVARRGAEFSAGLGAFLDKRPPEFS